MHLHLPKSVYGSSDVLLDEIFGLVCVLLVFSRGYDGVVDSHSFCTNAVSYDCVLYGFRRFGCLGIFEFP